MKKVKLNIKSYNQTNSFHLLLSESEIGMLSSNPKKVVLDAQQRKQTDPKVSLHSHLNNTRLEPNSYQGEDLDVPTNLRRGFPITI